MASATGATAQLATQGDVATTPAKATRTLERLAIVVREGAYDRVLTPFAFAYLAAANGAQVDMLFVNWAVRAVMQGEANRLPMSAEHRDEGDYVRRQVELAGLPAEIPALVTALKQTGTVAIYVCSLAAQIFGATRENLLPEVDEIVGATWFLSERVLEADTTQYF
ncbi:MAG: DsrE family protein [Actinomycetota bacterium]|jgi:peroxiredoxin family protein|nr:DsrE family protein [Actinomycetota bacterium]